MYILGRVAFVAELLASLPVGLEGRAGRPRRGNAVGHARLKQSQADQVLDGKASRRRKKATEHVSDSEVSGAETADLLAGGSNVETPTNLSLLFFQNYMIEATPPCTE